MKTVIIGGSHGGVQTALTLKRVKPDETVLIFERSNFISFIASGINLFLKGLVPKLNDAQLFKEEQLKESGVQLYKRHEVLSADIANKKICVKNLETGEITFEGYDSLVLAMGSTQKGERLLDYPSKGCAFTYKSYQESAEILEAIQKAETITIVGAGYIGVELSNTIYGMGKDITIIESSDSILHRYFEKEMVKPIEGAMRDAGIRLLLNDTILDITPAENGQKLVKTTVEEFPVDLVLFCINGKPNNRLVKGQVTTLSDHTIKVNRYMETSARGVYAVGDLVSYPVTNITGTMYTPLVNETVRTATVAAMAIAGMPIAYQANQRTTMTNVFSRYSTSIGITLRQANFEGVEFQTSLFQKRWMENEEEHFLEVLLVVNEDDGALLGVQIVGSEELTATADYLSLAINRGVTVEELITMDCAFHPELNLPYHFLNEAALEHIIENSRPKVSLEVEG